LILLFLASACSALACSVDQAPEGLKRTPAGSGPFVRFDTQHKPLPDIPFPNDVGTWPDPTSRTGLRVNPSLFAPTSIERDAREKFGELEGWATYGWISVAFDKPAGQGRDDAAIDLSNVAKRHQGDDYELADDAVYLVNLTTGIPVPLDLGEGSFNYVLRDKDRFGPNDTRRSEQFLLFESFDETAGRDIDTPYSPALDTDFDGVLDIPNLDHPRACPAPPSDPSAPNQLERDRCLADHLLDWYQRQDDTLLLSPMIPLEEMTQYAVVLTDRLVDRSGNPVRSPFDFVYHPMQERGIATLRQHLSNPALASYYGDIGGTGLDHVAFAWVFTTQPTYDDMRRLRDGLYGSATACSPGRSANRATTTPATEAVPSRLCPAPFPRRVNARGVPRQGPAHPGGARTGQRRHRLGVHHGVQAPRPQPRNRPAIRRAQRLRADRQRDRDPRKGSGRLHGSDGRGGPHRHRAVLCLLGAAAEEVGLDRILRANTVKRSALALQAGQVLVRLHTHHAHRMVPSTDRGLRSNHPRASGFH
jgi:hypothetical protein